MISELVLISPDPHADLEIHLLDMMNMSSSRYKYNVVSEVRKIKGIRILCMFGSSEDPDRRSVFRFKPVEYVELPGKHHLRFEFQPIVKKILEN